jgi:hypothetical protein
VAECLRRALCVNFEKFSIPCRTLLPMGAIYEHNRLQPDTSTAPSPMGYASMGYTSMGFTSMCYTSIELLNFVNFDLQM